MVRNKRHNLNSVDWNKIQTFYNDKHSIKDITKTFGISQNLISRARSKNLFYIDKNRVYRPSAEVKKRISEKRTEYLRKNPDKYFWKKNSKNVSVPCERFKSKLRENNILFEEEYEPLEDRLFAVDIAFPYLGVIIEVNGTQHYDKNGLLTEYFQKRHDLIKNKGWHIIEMHYALFFKDEACDKIITDIKSKDITNYKEYIVHTDYRFNIMKEGNLIREPSPVELIHKPKKSQMNICPTCNKHSKYRISNQCKYCRHISDRLVVRPPLSKLLKYVVDIGCSGTGRMYGVSGNAIREWINYYQKYDIHT